MSTHSSWLAYSTLRSLCILHGIEVQNVSRRTLYNWQHSVVHPDCVDLLRLRLIVSGVLNGSAIDDIYRSCGYVP